MKYILIIAVLLFSCGRLPAQKRYIQGPYNKAKFLYSNVPIEAEGRLILRDTLPDYPDTVKIKMLIDEGGTIPIQRNGWQIIPFSPTLAMGCIGDCYPLFFADKKTRVDQSKVWQFKRFNW